MIGHLWMFCSSRLILEQAALILYKDVLIDFFSFLNLVLVLIAKEKLDEKDDKEQ